MYVLSVACKQQSCGIIEENSDTVVTQLVAEAVLVRVVDPLTNPVHRHAGRVLNVICRTQYIRHYHYCDNKPDFIVNATDE